MQTLDSSEDVDLELMFAEIRRYPLLTADEEKSIDSRKWHAVETLSRVFGEVADLRVILAEVLHNALECPPEVKRFPSREQHFTLRRELAPYFSDGNRAEAARTSHKVLRGRVSKKRATETVAQFADSREFDRGHCGIHATTRRGAVPRCRGGRCRPLVTALDISHSAHCPRTRHTQDHQACFARVHRG